MRDASELAMYWRNLALPVVLSFVVAGASSHSWALSDQEFETCVERFKREAASEGIAPQVVADHLANVKLSQRVLELDRQQPEFTTTFADYFGRRVTEDRVKRGRELMEQHSELLGQVAREYGVPAQYLVSFWGLETNFGSFFGKMSVLDSLATLGCDARRSGYFTTELMSALRIIEEGAVTRDSMEGSWAGAMGHVQFMPSVFLRHAVDYDGDGRRDLWGSVPDALASAANFLRGLGWENGLRWGREVQLPDNFPYLQAGLNNRQPLSEWAKLGVRQANGASLPQADVEASLLVPAGHQGPAFLVYKNFDVIMRWNRSEFYGLAVGHLADQIAGAGRLQQPPPGDAPRLSRDQVIHLQQALNERGFETGTPDGIIGPATRQALSRFQHKNDLVADGFPGAEVLAKLGVVAE
jgi:membrane-bound lytic murein transglycosylase B